MIARSLLAVLLLSPASAQSWSVAFQSLTGVIDLELQPNGEIAMLTYDYVQPQTHYYLSSVDLAGTMQDHRRLEAPLLDLTVGTTGALLGAGRAGNLKIRPWAWSGDFASGDRWSRASTDLSDYEDGAIRAACATSDGGMLAVGTTWDSDFGCCTRPLIVRYAADGSMLWSRLTDPRDSAYGIVLSDGTILVAASFLDTVFPSLDLIKLSATGDVLWVRREGAPAPTARLAQRTDGSIVMVTWGGSVVEMDAQGSVTRSRRIVANNWFDDERPRLMDLVATPDGGFATIGTLEEQPGDSDMFVVKFDGMGDLQWQRRIGDAGSQQGRALAAVADGGLLAGGSTDDGALLVRLSASADVAGCAPLPAGIPIVDAEWSWIDVGTSSLQLAGTSKVGPASTAQAPVQESAVCLGGEIGTRHCSPANANSSGGPALVWAGGSEAVLDNDLILAATSMPASQFGYFLAGQFSGTTMPPGTQGVLCLVGGPISRFVDDVLSTGAHGAFDLTVDLTAIPGHGAVQVGETWYFQAWFRDVNPTSTSNFTDAVGLTYF